MMVKMGRACSTHGMMEDLYIVFAGNPQGKRRSKRPNSGMENDIKMYLTGCAVF